MNNDQKVRLEYDLYVTDIMGTTTPKSQIDTLNTALLNLRGGGLEELCSTTNVSPEEIPKIVEKGMESHKKGDKGSPEFKKYMTLMDVVSPIAYKTGQARLEIYDDVPETLDAIRTLGGRVSIFSSGGLDASVEGMKGNGLDRLINNYYSSSESDIGDKTKPESYKAIAKKERVDLKRTCYVTDDKKEAVAAVGAGIGKVFYIDRKAKESGVIENGYTIINDYRQVVQLTAIPDRAQEQNVGYAHT